VKFFGLWAPVAGFMGLLFLSSSRSTYIGAGRVSDKLLHTLAYLVLGVLLQRAAHGGFRGLRAGPAIAAVLVTAAYGLTDELHQIYVPGRIASVTDWLADVVGALLAVPLVGLLGTLLTRRVGARS